MIGRWTLLSCFEQCVSNVCQFLKFFVPDFLWNNTSVFGNLRLTEDWLVPRYFRGMLENFLLSQNHFQSVLKKVKSKAVTEKGWWCLKNKLLNSESELYNRLSSWKKSMCMTSQEAIMLHSVLHYKSWDLRIDA